MKQLPNALTGMRIILSLTLLLFIGKPLLYAVVYFCCGISDVADGFIARKFNVESRTGAKLDSLADFVFTAVNLYVLITSVHLENEITVILIITAVAVIRIANLVMTKRRFDQWGVIHTVANKAAGVVLFLSIPFCIWVSGFPVWLVIPVGAVIALSAIEEMLILITAKEYDANRKSILSIR